MNNRFNAFMNDHFRTCTLLARGHDEHRNREVEVREVPGVFDVFGISDGVDAWLCPANAMSDLIERARQSRTAILEGKQPQIEATRKRRRRVLIEDDEQPQPQKKERVRVALA